MSTRQKRWLLFGMARARNCVKAVEPKNRYLVRRSSFQPDGRTAAANRIFTISPGTNGNTTSCSAAKGFVCVSKENQAQPLTVITTEPMAIAAAAEKNLRSQPFSANAPVTYAAAGNATR